MHLRRDPRSRTQNACAEQDQKKKKAPATLTSRMLKNPFSPRLLKRVQMQGGARRAE